MWRDLERLCADLALPFRRPDPFPQNSLLAARVALVGLDHGWGEDFCRAVFRAQFGERAPHRRSRPSPTSWRNLKVEPAPVLAAAQSDAIKARLRAQTEEAQRLGLFGAPSFTTADGELFWGNDRLERRCAGRGGRDGESSERRARPGARPTLPFATQPLAHGSSRIGRPARAM